MRPASLITVVLSILPVSMVAAQDQSPILPGARVRVTTPHLPRGQLVGDVTRIDADTVVVGSTPVELRSVTRLDISTGRRSHSVTGLGIGFLVGAGVGAILGASAATDESGSCPPTKCTLAGAGILGVVGLPIGALVGALIRTDRWQEVPPDRWPVATLGQRDGQLTLTVAVQF